MSNQHRPRSTWQLFALAVTALVSCGGLHSALAQIPNLLGVDTRIERSPNPKANHSRTRKPTGGATARLPNAADAKQEAIERAIADGNQARDANDYERALAGYRKAEELNPQDARAHYGLGNVYSDLYCTDSAIESYHKALGIKKDYREALLALGYAYIAKERYDEAEKEFLEVVPRDAGAKIALGRVYAKKGKYQESINQINLVINDQSIEAKDRASAHIGLGDVYQIQQEWPEAIYQYEQAIGLNPEPGLQYVKLGLAQLLGAFLKSSQLTLGEVRTQDTEQFGASARKGTDNIQKGITEHHYNHPDGYYALGYGLMQQSRYRESVSALNTYFAKVHDLENKMPPLAAKCDYGFNRLYSFGYWELGFTDLQESHHESDSKRKAELLDEAIKQFSQSIKIKPDYATAYSSLAGIYFEQKKYNEAVEQYQKAILYETQDSNKAGSYGMIGIAYFAMGRYSDAFDHSKRAIELDPKLPMGYQTLAMVCEQQGNLDEAIVERKNAMEREPEPTAHSYAWLAGDYLFRARKNGNEDDYVEAIRLLRKALELNHAFASAYFDLGKVYTFYKGGAMADQALANLEKAAEYDAKNPAVYYAIADVYFSHKHNNEAAIHYLGKAIEVKSDYVRAYWFLGLIYHEKKDDAEAVKQLMKALELDPKYLDANLSLIAIYAAQKNYPEAIKHLNKAIEDSPTDFFAYKELAKVYEAQGKNEDAIHYYEEAMNRLKADDSAIRTLYLGRIARLRGQYAEAIEIFTKLKFPDEPTQPAFEIGVTYVVSKNKKAAEEQYQKLVQLKSPLAEDLLRKINEMK